MDYNKLKLVIWDLDETFWHGILSDGTAVPIQENALLIHNMVNSGVMCSICSKNDEDDVRKFLRELNLQDLFVFISVNWSPKGNRVKQIITEMQLREHNVLFIDDNPLNRAEASNACPNIIVADVDVIPQLQDFYRNNEKKDLSHKRLKQYKMLEEKSKFKAVFGSNEEFLYQSKIHVDILQNCIEHIERIHELVQRSNQLNFTKIRSSIPELEEMILNPEFKCGYVTVNDNFGEYGIVGFYAMQHNTLIHFVFSCRTLGMGVEQYVYRILGKPAVTVVGEVSSDLLKPDPKWINQKDVENEQKDKIELGTGKVLFKGPCDIAQIFSYIKDRGNIIKEFTYVNDKGVSIESPGHTTHIIESLSVSEELKNRYTRELPFGDKGLFETHFFDNDISCIVYSLFTDPHLGLYRDKESGTVIAFGEYTIDLTNEDLWEKLIEQKVFTANCKFTRDNLTFFRDHYIFLGRMTTEKIIENLETIRKYTPSSTTIVLVLGSETAFENETNPAYLDRHVYNRELNRLVRMWATKYKNVRLLDFNKYITGQESFTNNINHFSRKTYYEASKDLVSMLEEGKFKLKPWAIMSFLKGAKVTLYHGKVFMISVYKKIWKIAYEKK